MPRKRGKLSLDEEKFIRDNADQISFEEIAEQLNRTVTPIKNYCAKNHIVHKEMKDDDWERWSLRVRLEQKSYWAEVKKQFDDEEVDYFASVWLNTMEQFNEDVLSTEELQIKQWITLEILANRILADRRRSIEQVDRLQNQLEAEYNLPIDNRDPETIARLEGEVAMIRNSLSAYNTDYKNLLKESAGIQKGLKAGRDDRVKKVEDSKTTLSGLIKLLEDPKVRSDWGAQIEKFRLAKEFELAKLSQYHKFADGKIDRPVLNAEVMEKFQGETND